MKLKKITSALLASLIGLIPMTTKVYAEETKATINQTLLFSKNIGVTPNATVHYEVTPESTYDADVPTIEDSAFATSAFGLKDSFCRTSYIFVFNLCTKSC